VPAVLDIDVTHWTTIQVEARGSGLNLWLDESGGRRWLYKATRIPEGSTEPQGEDWAEKVAERLAALIGLPCNQVELAHRRVGSGRENGVLSRDLAGGPIALQNGALLLTDIPEYVYREWHNGRLRPPPNHRGHSVENVVRELRRLVVSPPVGWEVTGVDAVGVFAGYLVFDAWISNLDRHEDNWAVLHHPNGSISLAPTYDHGAALGSSLIDVRREQLASDAAGLESFAAKAFGKKFEDGHKVPLTVFAASALRAAGPQARQFWTERLAAVEPADVEEAVAGTPRMSDAARSFCLQLLAINRERVLNVCR
jgi:hypothetical protein